MAKLDLNPQPPLAELDTAIAKTDRMISSVRGKDKIAVARFASAKAHLRHALADLEAGILRPAKKQGDQP